MRGKAEILYTVDTCTIKEKSGGKYTSVTTCLTLKHGLTRTMKNYKDDYD